jgi:hypothetical protein
VQSRGQETAASDGLVAAHDALVAAHHTFEELSELRGQLATLDDQRQQLEAQLAQQGESANEAQLNHLLRQLRAIERARAECTSGIDTRADADSRYATALDRKRELLRSTKRPILVEIDRLDTEIATAAAYVARLDDAFACSEQAEQSLAWLDETLNDAKAWSIRDLFLPRGLDLPVRVAENAAIRRAQDHQATVLRALRSLEQKLEGVLADAPPILDLREVKIAYQRIPLVFPGFTDALSGIWSVDVSLWRWVARVRAARPALDKLQEELSLRRRRAQRALDELSAQRARLILDA